MINHVKNAASSDYAEQVESYSKQIDELEARQPLDAVDKETLQTAKFSLGISVEGFIAATRRETRDKQ